DVGQLALVVAGGAVIELNHAAPDGVQLVVGGNHLGSAAQLDRELALARGVDIVDEGLRRGVQAVVHRNGKDRLPGGFLGGGARRGARGQHCEQIGRASCRDRVDNEV